MPLLIVRRGGAGPGVRYCALAAARPWTAARQKLAAAVLRGTAAALPARGRFMVERQGPRSSWALNAAQLLGRCGLADVAVARVRHWPPGTEPPPPDPLLEELLGPAACRTRLAGRRPASRRARGRRPGASAEAVARFARDELAMPLPDFAAAHAAALGARLGRPLSAAELAVLAQFNAEHSRHHVFAARWRGKDGGRSMLASLRATWTRARAGAPVAYSDHAAVLAPAAGTLHPAVKTETHNHPTALDPFAGSATGVGGEIRDGMAAGRGGRAAAGCAGLLLAGLPAEPATGPVKSPLEILLAAPLGWAAYGNEFGRPTIAGFMRPWQQPAAAGGMLSFAKPAMLAGGVSWLPRRALRKRRPAPGDLILQLGGLGAETGVGGGTAASAPLGPGGGAALARSVQRPWAEMQRRCQETLAACAAAAANPVLRIHDVGAGGIANAAAEVCAPFGCELDLAAIPMAAPGASAAAILCNEAQERFLLIVRPPDHARVAAAAAAERCPLRLIGRVTADGVFSVRAGARRPVALPRDGLHARRPPLAAAPKPRPAPAPAARLDGVDWAKTWHAVLRHPAVGDKSALITICDRGVGGLVARDQLVGPRQVAVADAAAVMADHHGPGGCAFALGERPALAAADPAAAARIAVAEALANLACLPVGPLGRVKLSLNWLADAGDEASLADLRAAVAGLCDSFLPELGLAVVMGKDSLAMRAELPQAGGGTETHRAPSCCVAGAWAPVADADAAALPLLSGRRDTLLLHLGAAAPGPLGGSVLAEVLGLAAEAGPDVAAADLRAWWDALQRLHAEGLVLACHDVSDGGLLAAVAEMCMAAGRGAELNLDAACARHLDTDGWDSLGAGAGGGGRELRLLAHEGPGVVIEVAAASYVRVLDAAAAAGMARPPQLLGRPRAAPRLRVLRDNRPLLDEDLAGLERSWRSCGQSLRQRRDAAGPEVPAPFAGGLHATPTAPRRRRPRPRRRPAALLLREQGGNGHAELAAALAAGGFAVHAAAPGEEIPAARWRAARLLALPGGFAYGDVLGAGWGWAQVLARDPRLRGPLRRFLAGDGLVLGICNGCQALSHLGGLLGAGPRLPRFVPNRSGRFEARLAQVEVLPSPSPFLAPLVGARLPVPVACGEGRTLAGAGDDAVPALRFVDASGLPAEDYPANPLGSAGGVCGYAGADGRVTALMPHPERAWRPAQLSWRPPAWCGAATPWLDCFAAARDHCAGL